MVVIERKDWVDLYNNKSILGIVTARGGSKRLPGKNLMLLDGKPLIAWTVTEAGKSKYLDKLVISSEDQNILTTAKEYGAEVPFVRPDDLARDETSSIDVVWHVINQLNAAFDYILLLQPTSPLRTVKDIDGCIEFGIGKNAPSVVGVNQLEKPANWLYEIDSENKISPLIKSVDVVSAFVVNGALYLTEINWLKKTGKFISSETLGFVMPRNHSVDIDTMEDFRYCEWLLSSGI